MKITEGEYEEMLSWIDDPSTPACGDDDWEPNGREVMASMMPLFMATQGLQTQRGRTEALRILTFLLWISETPEVLDRETDRILRGFLKEHMILPEV